MTATRRLASTILVLAMLMAITAVPAFAAAVGSAAITSGDLLSGQGAGVTVRVTNNGPNGNGLPGPLGTAGAGDINAVQIEVPASVFGAQTVTVPAGWDGEYDSEIGFVYVWATGSGLARTGTLDITINGTAKLIADDKAAPMPVFVSDDGGRTLSSAGAPSLTSRILQVTQIRAVKPVDAQNADQTQVTAGQDTAWVRVAAKNFGSQSRNVTLNAAKTGGGSTSAAVASQIVTLTTGQSASRDLVTTFGTGTGALNLQGTATAGTSAAVPLDAATITVQQAFDGTYVANSLSPQAVVQGNPYSFSLNVNKVGAQPADLAATFKILNTTYTSSTTAAFPANSNNTKLTFPSKVIPAAPNGEYNTELRATGFDYNGAKVDKTLTPNVVNLDNLLPVVTLAADVGAAAVNGAEKAAGNGRSITFSGSVKLGEGGANCTNCTVVESYVMTDGGAKLPFPLSINSSGTLSGSSSFTFPAGTLTAWGVVKVAKANSLSGDAESNVFEVDIIAPYLTKAVTGRDNSGDYITVFLSELVNATAVSPADWTVDNNRVRSVTARPQANGATSIELRLLNAINSNATPAVTYKPVGSLVSSRMTDRVALAVLDDVLESIDGIVPEAPVIQQVQNLGLQDGEFWTNLIKPTVTLAGMVANDVLYIYHDTNNNNIPEDGELVFEGTATAASETITLASSLGSTDSKHKLIARMFDNSGFGDVDTELVNVDRTLPYITSYSVVGNDVTVTFNEPLRATGRNAAFDWTVVATQDGTTASRTVSSVSGSGTTRSLSVSTASYDPTRGAITGVRFKYKGPAADRYDDRATNFMIDQLAN